MYSHTPLGTPLATWKDFFLLAMSKLQKLSSAVGDVRTRPPIPVKCPKGNGKLLHRLRRMLPFFRAHHMVLLACPFYRGSVLLYAYGRNTRVVPHSIDGVTHTVLSYEAYALPHTTLLFDPVGRGLTHHHVKIMIEHRRKFTTTAELEIDRS
ncbi:Actin-2 [Taenia solium]|eukprot:TsM_000325900 transcript=TsM_000325900 gene=TsM_000325900